MKSKIIIVCVMLFILVGCDQNYDYTQNTNTTGDSIVTPAENCKAVPEHVKEIAKMSAMEKTNRSLNCRFPPPPIGRWHAVYTAEFATKFNLPTENISEDFSEGVEYMEMKVVPHRTSKWSPQCYAKMLIKRPNDISYIMSPDKFSVLNFPDNFELSHHFDFQGILSQLKLLNFISASSRDYKFNKKGFMQTTHGLFLENIIEGYDYIVANYPCGMAPMNYEYFPDGYAFRLAKASILGKYEHNSDAVIEEKKHNGTDSHHFIHIPKEIILTLYKDTNFRGK